jgi:hypothetical protein
MIEILPLGATWPIFFSDSEHIFSQCWWYWWEPLWEALSGNRLYLLNKQASIKTLSFHESACLAALELLRIEPLLGSSSKIQFCDTWSPSSKCAQNVLSYNSWYWVHHLKSTLLSLQFWSFRGILQRQYFWNHSDLSVKCSYVTYWRFDGCQWKPGLDTGRGLRRARTLTLFQPVLFPEI